MNRLFKQTSIFWTTAVLMLTFLLGVATPIGVATTGVTTTYASQTSTIVGETGRVTLDNTIDNGFVATVNTTNSYTDPVVVAFITSRNSSQSVDVRVRNVTGSSFQIFMEEPDGGNHVAETAAYIVMEKGRHVLDGGLVVEAGTLTTASLHVGGNAYGGDAVTFAAPFANPPAVLHTLNTYTSRTFMSSAVHDVTSTGFQAQQEAAETGSTQLGEEIGWIALATGTGTTNGATYEVGMANDGSSDGVDNTPHIIIFNVLFATTPDIVAKMIVLDSSGGNGAWARGAGQFTNNVLMVYAEEDQVGDAERNHGDEHFAWAAFAPNTTLVATSCFVEATGDDVTDFATADATAVQQAIDAASPNDTLRLAGTCAGASGGQLATINKNLTLVGGYHPTDWSLAPDPVTNPTVLDAENNGRVLTISGNDVTLNNLTLINGTAHAGGGIYFAGSNFALHNSVVANNSSVIQGGGLFLENTTVNSQISHTTFRQNQGLLGGGLFNAGAALTVEDSTFYDNTAMDDEGAGLYNQNSTGGLTILNSTISGNHGSGLHHSHTGGAMATADIRFTTIADNSLAGVALSASNPVRNTAVLASSLIANNGTDCTNPDGATLDTTNGYNLDSDGSCVTAGVDHNITSATPNIGPLQDNGGATWTHELLASSPALNHVLGGANGCAISLAADQRGIHRPQATGCDIGAFELEQGLVCDVAELITALEVASVAGQTIEIELAANCVYNLTAVHTADPDGYGAVGLPPIYGTAVVNGNGATIERDAAADPFRLFYIANDGNLMLNQLTLQNGLARGGDGAMIGGHGGRGGGAAGMGGAIFNKGDLTIVQSTLLENAAAGGRGGHVDQGGSNGPGGGGGGMGGDAIRQNGGGSNGGRSSIPAGEGGGGWGSTSYLSPGHDGGFGGGGGGSGFAASNQAAAGGNGGFGGGGGGAGNFWSGGSAGSGGSGGFGGGDGGQSSQILGAGGGGGGAGMGGAIFNYGGTIAIENSTIVNNVARRGTASGGLADPGLTFGGALFNYEGAVTLRYATVANNQIHSSTQSRGGGVYNYGSSAELTLVGSVLADSANGKTDCHNFGGGTVTESNTIIESHANCGTPTEVDPQLGPLGDYGGATPTLPLSLGSPALDQVASGTDGCATTITADQRGEARPANGACDVGAFEGAVETAVSPTLTISNNQLTHSNNNPSCTYNLYQSSSPYSGFGLSQANIGTTPVDISGDVGGAPDYYYVEVDCGGGSPASGATAVSNTVGEFSFAIVPGS